MKRKGQEQAKKGAGRTPKRTLLLKAIALSAPFLVFLLLELVLRIAHYGFDTRLFIDYSQDSRYLVLNPDASKRYFPDPALAPSGNSEPFKKIKDSNTFRIFVLGESTTIGYPYFHNGSFHRWLQYRLMHTFRDRTFEIINLSLTGVSSYTVADFGKELVNYEPDAILIYSGQNEYYGTMGVGSVNSLSGRPALVHLVLQLRRLRTVQFFAALIKKLAGTFGGKNNGQNKNLMQRMAGDQHIAFMTDLYKKGISQYQYNFRSLLTVLDNYHIPVFLSNLVSNEAGLQPFVSIEAPGQTDTAFKKEFDKGVEALKDHREKDAFNDFRAADSIYPDHALCNYYLGMLSYQRGDYNQAKTRFSRAKDLDGLRFRAPSKLNEVISGLCNEFSNTHLVDTKAEFEVHSDHQIIGNELILEHVHPNLDGYALMSDVFYKAMKRAAVFKGYESSEMTLGQLKNEMPITSVDSLAACYKISRLKMSWPFTSEKSEDTTFRAMSEEQELACDLAYRHARWTLVMERLYQYYITTDSFTKAARVAEAATLECPYDPECFDRAGNVFGKMNDFEQATFYFSKAFTLSPSCQRARMLFVLYLDIDRPLNALPYIDYAIGCGNIQGLDILKRETQSVIRLEKALAKDPANRELLIRIANEYGRMGNKLGEMKYKNTVIANSSRYPPNYVDGSPAPISW
jgi:tetratricopeptide (TPR) repeat protein